MIESIERSLSVLRIREVEVDASSIFARLWLALVLNFCLFCFMLRQSSTRFLERSNG
jgi:hypothetical protein